MVNNKFSELGCNAQEILVDKQDDIECTLFIIHVIISSVGIY